MKKLVEQALEDFSSRDVFVFRVVCSECGAAYGNKPVRFSKAGITPEKKGKSVIYDTLYEQECHHARLNAIREAADHMNCCPICKRLVCNRCFLICDDLDMCKQCAARLEEAGSPVFSDVLEPAM